MADSYGGGTTVPGEDDVTRGGPSTPDAPEPTAPTPPAWPTAGPARPRPGGPEAWSAGDQWRAGWYADPWESGRQRRWTGTAWTAETRGGDGPWISGLTGATQERHWIPAEPPGEAMAVPARSPMLTRRRLIALIATLAVVAMILGFTIAYVAADESSKSTNALAPTTLPPATVSPSPTTNPFGSTPSTGSTPGTGTTPGTGSTPAGGTTPGTGSSGTGTPGAGSSPGGSAGAVDPSEAVLQQLVVRQSDVPASDSVALTTGGGSVAGAPTLDLCNGTFPSESLRTARLQVALYNTIGDPVFSTEAVLYRNGAATTQAFSELRSVAARCPSTPVVSPVGEQTVSTKFNKAPDGAWPRVAGVDRQAYDFVTTDEFGNSTQSVAVYLRRGRALMGVYFSDPTGSQEAVNGQTTVPAIVNVFQERLAAIPAQSITP